MAAPPDQTVPLEGELTTVPAVVPDVPDTTDSDVEPTKPKRMGRPLKFKSKKKLQEAIDAYFKDCDPHYVTDVIMRRPLKDNGLTDMDADPEPFEEIRLTPQKPYTISDLAVFLNTSRETLMNYEDREDFFDTIKAAKDRCAAWAESYLYSGKNVTGAIFSLKANFNMREEEAPNKLDPLTMPGGLHFHNHVESKKDMYAD